MDIFRRVPIFLIVFVTCQWVLLDVTRDRGRFEVVLRITWETKKSELQKVIGIDSGENDKKFCGIWSSGQNMHPRKQQHDIKIDPLCFDGANIGDRGYIV